MTAPERKKITVETTIQAPIGKVWDLWTGAFEQYFLIEKNGTTILQVDRDVKPEFKSYFMETWPKVLKIIKMISES